MWQKTFQDQVSTEVTSMSSKQKDPIEHALRRAAYAVRAYYHNEIGMLQGPQRKRHTQILLCEQANVLNALRWAIQATREGSTVVTSHMLKIRL